MSGAMCARDPAAHVSQSTRSASAADWGRGVSVHLRGGYFLTRTLHNLLGCRDKTQGPRSFCSSQYQLLLACKERIVYLVLQSDSAPPSSQPDIFPPAAVPSPAGYERWPQRSQPPISPQGPCDTSAWSTAAAIVLQTQSSQQKPLSSPRDRFNSHQVSSSGRVPCAGHLPATKTACSPRPDCTGNSTASWAR